MQMPYDVKQECLWIVRGYSRRAREPDRTPQDIQRVRAVDHALAQVGQDIRDAGTRQRLERALMMNCESGRRYPFERLDADGFSRRDFYRRKEKFLLAVARYMGIA